MTPRTRIVALFLTAALVLPAVGAAVLAWSVSDRGDRLDQVPVAIVNDDEIVRGDQPMAAGRALSSALVHPDDDQTTLGWTVTSEADAAAGLADADYYAVLTIPEDFSASVLSAASDEPHIAELTLETNPAASATAALAAKVVAETAAATLGESVTDAVLTTTLTGVSTLSTSLGEAADAATQLADGADGLVDGTAQLDSGVASLASGLGTLADGTAQLATGADELADAAGTVADGITIGRLSGWPGEGRWRWLSVSR